MNSYFCRKSLAQSVLTACENSRDLVHGISGSSRVAVFLSV